MKTVKLYIDGVEKFFISLNYVKSHPSPDPDTFDVVLTPEQLSGIDNFDVVEIEKDGVTEFYGFVEEITPDIGEDGLEYSVSGRCWKVILWKKWTERYQESREIGPYNADDNVIESGFFGSVNPTELIKFIMRCPCSVHPQYYVRHKIGWGIPSDFWNCCANNTADCYDPDWVSMREVGLSWRSRGTTTAMFSTTLEVPLINGFDHTYDEWDSFGVEPWLDDDDTGWFVSKIDTMYLNENKTMGNFVFDDLPANSLSIDTVVLKIHSASPNYQGPNFNIQIWLYNGISWKQFGTIPLTTGYAYHLVDVSDYLDTVAKVNDAQIKFTMDCTYFGMPPYYTMFEITYACLNVTYTSVVTDEIFQKVGDYFIVNLGGFYNDVTAILIESRNNPANFAKNYNIQWTSLSNCCNVGGGTWNDFDPPVNVVNNEYRDILHSWKPQDEVHCIRIMLTASSNQAWEISQVYIWPADEYAYRLMDE